MQAGAEEISQDNLISVPESNRRASFASGFGQRVLLTVDTEEEFDWSAPFHRDNWGLNHVTALHGFQQFCEGINVVPVYLVDWPVATSPLAHDILGEAVRTGRAEIGVQLHPWVNPPYEEEVNAFNSCAGNLPVELERRRFIALHDVIIDNFGTAPMIYRAGRYGLGPGTADLLRERGIAIDSSVRAGFDYSDQHGPNYLHHPTSPYWVDEGRNLLELPLTTVFWGMLRRQGRWLYPQISRIPHLRGLMSKLGLLERIALTPEGITLDEALRGIDIAVDDGLPLLVLSFHSPSLKPGFSPYVRSEADLEEFYAWMRGVYAYLDQRGVRPTSVAEIMQSVER